MFCACMNRYSASGWKRDKSSHFREHRITCPSIYKLSFKRKIIKIKRAIPKHYSEISAPQKIESNWHWECNYNTCCYGLCKHEAEEEMYLQKCKRLSAQFYDGWEHITSRHATANTRTCNMQQMRHTCVHFSPTCYKIWIFFYFEHCLDLSGICLCKA